MPSLSTLTPINWQITKIGTGLECIEAREIYSKLIDWIGKIELKPLNMLIIERSPNQF